MVVGDFNLFNFFNTSNGDTRKCTELGDVMAILSLSRSMKSSMLTDGPLILF